EIRGATSLVAYVVPRSPVTWEELRVHLRGELPAALVPAACRFLARLPLSPHGKVDRRALPGPEPDAAPFLAPRTAVEARLAAIWSEALGVAGVGLLDNFFDLGGDSILGLRIVARARQAGLRLRPRDLFEHPTVAELAPCVAAGPEILAEQGAVAGPVPLTPIQRWFLAPERTAPHHFNQSLLLAVRGALPPP